VFIKKKRGQGSAFRMRTGTMADAEHLFRNIQRTEKEPEKKGGSTEKVSPKKSLTFQKKRLTQT